MVDKIIDIGHKIYIKPHIHSTDPFPYVSVVSSSSESFDVFKDKDYVFS